MFLLAAAAVAFFTGMAAPFQGDDFPQIVNNVPVHSITNIGVFFRGGTFYNGHGLAPLGGTYYRPLMATVFSLIYTFFGANPIPFHLVQAALVLGSSFLLFLVFRRFGFHSLLALFLALTFLVHPIDSQVVFAIPYMQDALFFFFGIAAFWLLQRSQSKRTLIGVAVLLLLSLLSKETGILFVLISALYLFWWNRTRPALFAGAAGGAVIIWLMLRATAIGLLVNNANIGPIDKLDLGGRLLTMPSVLLLYITKTFWPFALASSYFFVHPAFSWDGVLLPLILDLLVITVLIGAGIVMKRTRTASELQRTYWFFFIWTALGFAAYSQIVPLDATANEVWFHFSMAGFLGMMGTAITAFAPKIHVNVLVAGAAACIVVLVLTVTTTVRGTVWSDLVTLAQQDIANSPDDWAAWGNLASEYVKRGECTAAISAAQQSIAMFPNGLNYNTLGDAYTKTGQYALAAEAFNAGLKVEFYYGLADGLAQLTTVYGDPAADKQFLESAVSAFSQDSALWAFLAYFDYNHNDIQGAQAAITQAAQFSPGNQTIAVFYQRMMARQPLGVTLTPPTCTPQ